MKKYLIVFILLFVTAACNSYQENMPSMEFKGKHFPKWYKSEDDHNVTIDRFQISRVGMFEDYAAYDSKRSIYIILDTKTGKEYVGLSGVGIAEMGSHSSGKMIKKHEQ